MEEAMLVSGLVEKNLKSTPEIEEILDGKGN